MVKWCFGVVKRWFGVFFCFFVVVFLGGREGVGWGVSTDSKCNTRQ